MEPSLNSQNLQTTNKEIAAAELARGVKSTLTPHIPQVP